MELLGTISIHLQTFQEAPSQSADQHSQLHEVLLPAPLSPVIMQAYYRIQTRTAGGPIRCLTSPQGSAGTTFQDCLSNSTDITQTYLIDRGKKETVLPTGQLWGMKEAECRYGVNFQGRFPWLP
jgi:hypothetical protein